MAMSVIATAISSISKYKHIFPELTFSELARSSSSANVSEVVFSVLGTSVGGAIAVGLISLIYSNGLIFYYAGLSFLMGLMFVYMLIPRIRRNAAASNADTFEDYLSGNSPWIKVSTSVVNFIAFMGLFVSQLLALEAVLSYIFSDMSGYLFWIITAIIIIYTSVYGLYGILKNEKIQVFFTLGWLAALLWFIVTNITSLQAANTLSLEYFSGTSLGITPLLVGIFFLPWSALARADHWQRIRAANTDKSAQTAYAVLIVALLFLYTVFALAAVLLSITQPNLLNPNQIAFHIFDAAPNYIIVCGVVGIVATLVSSADSFVNLASLAATKLIQALSQILSGSRNNYTHSTPMQYRFMCFLCGLLGVLCVIFFNDLGVWVVIATTSIMVFVPGIAAKFGGYPLSDRVFLTSVLTGTAAYCVFLVAPVVDSEAAFFPAALCSLAVVVTAVICQKKLAPNEGNESID